MFDQIRNIGIVRLTEAFHMELIVFWSRIFEIVLNREASLFISVHVLLLPIHIKLESCFSILWQGPTNANRLAEDPLCLDKLNGLLDKMVESACEVNRRQLRHPNTAKPFSTHHILVFIVPPTNKRKPITISSSYQNLNIFTSKLPPQHFSEIWFIFICPVYRLSKCYFFSETFFCDSCVYDRQFSSRLLFATWFSASFDLYAHLKFSAWKPCSWLSQEKKEITFIVWPWKNTFKSRRNIFKSSNSVSDSWTLFELLKTFFVWKYLLQGPKYFMKISQGRLQFIKTKSIFSRFVTITGNCNMD